MIGLADGHAALGDPLRHLALHGDAEVSRLRDGEHVARADGNVERHLACSLDFDGLPREDDEGRRPLERDLADAVAVRARDGLDETCLRVDEDRRLGALALDDSGLEGHGGRADRALATRHVVAAGIDEEEPEVGAGRDRLGHHRDQEASVATGLEAETGAEMVEPLLKPSALFADRLSRQLSEAAREQPHADPRRMEVDGPDHAIGAHRHLLFAPCSCITVGPRSSYAMARAPSAPGALRARRIPAWRRAGGTSPTKASARADAAVRHPIQAPRPPSSVRTGQGSGLISTHISARRLLSAPISPGGSCRFWAPRTTTW